MAEVPFDECDIEGAYRNEEESIREAIEASDKSDHPGFPLEVVEMMMKAHHSADTRAYPRSGLLRFDRLDARGNRLHPYAVARDGDQWLILTYLHYSGEFQKIAESDFVHLRHAQ